MRIAQLTLAIAAPFVSVALFLALLTAAFAAVAQPVSPLLEASARTTHLGRRTPLAPPKPLMPLRAARPASPAVVVSTSAATTVASSALLSEFNELLKASSVNIRLKRTDRAYTVFAPTNAALQRIPACVREQAFQADNALLLPFVRTHIVKGSFTPEQLIDGRELITLTGRTLRVVREADGSILLDGAYRLRDAGQRTTNGMLYTLDLVITPL